MSKTYKKGSRRNLYNPSWCTHSVRITIEQRLKVEKRAEELHMNLADFTRMIVAEAVKDVRLTSADIMEVAERTAVNEQKNEKRMRGE